MAFRNKKEIELYKYTGKISTLDSSYDCKIIFSSAGKFLVIFNTSKLFIYDTESEIQLKVFNVESAYLYFCFSCDDEEFYIGDYCSDNGKHVFKLKKYNTRTWEFLREEEVPFIAYFEQIELYCYGSWFFVYYGSGVFRIFDKDSFRLLAVLENLDKYFHPERIALRINNYGAYCAAAENRKQQVQKIAGAHNAPSPVKLITEPYKEDK